MNNIGPADLQKAKLWTKYQELRDKYLKAKETPNNARVKTLEDLRPELEQLFSKPKPKRKPKAKKKTSTLNSSSSAGNKPSVPSSRGGGNCLEEHRTPSEPVCEWEALGGEFLDREAPIVEVITYVAKYLATPENMVKISDAPSPEAWGMLQSYRSSQARMDDFWDKVYPKLMPSKAQLEKTKVLTSLDGQDIVRTIDKILKINEKLDKKKDKHEKIETEFLVAEEVQRQRAKEYNQMKAVKLGKALNKEPIKEVRRRGDNALTPLLETPKGATSWGIMK